MRKTSEIVEFEGVRYYRYPDSPFAANRNYYQHPEHGSLHRAIWVSAHGPVPDGHEVHHLDSDTLNNTLPNLAALPISEHRSMSAQARRIYTFSCARCGKEFDSIANRSAKRRFCTKKCKRDTLNREYAARRKESS